MPDFQDNILFEKIRDARDMQAYDTLFRRWYPVLWSYACHFVGHEDAENIVQDVMVHLWEKAPSIILRGNISRYLFTAVKNRCLTLISRGNVKQKVMSSIRISLIDSYLDIDPCIAGELSARIRSEMDKLPDVQRRALEMNRFEEMSFASIAQKTGVSVKTVEYRVYQALRKLRAAMAEFHK